LVMVCTLHGVGDVEHHQHAMTPPGLSLLLNLRHTIPLRAEYVCLDTVLSPGGVEEDLLGRAPSHGGTGSSNPSSSVKESLSPVSSMATGAKAPLSPGVARCRVAVRWPIRAAAGILG
jgi:hypothetical protein